ncbi:MAG: D-alanine--D-alanine ligase [Proteobacteria bacterium]|nr:D-alanine--D-alanine ligase [Pseudomonadota bacterium]
MGGSSSEREISLKSGKAVLKALLSKGYEAEKLDIADGLEPLLSGRYKRVFIALHGVPGEDGTVQGLLELLGIEYTGSGLLASAVTMDKTFAKRVVAAEGVVTPEFKEFASRPGAEEVPELGFDYPVVVKPVSEGSTVGVTKVESPEGLSAAIGRSLKYGTKVLVERFVSGREVTVGVIGGKALPVIEVVPKGGFYDFEAKYTKGMTEYIVPADFDKEMLENLSHTAVSVYEILGCRGQARVDFIIEDSTPYFLEINTIPGMTETSLLPKAAAAAGIGFEELTASILESAALDSGRRGVQ